MANKVKLVSNTRIYLDTRALMDEILDVTPNFPRSYKYTIGSKLHDLATDIIQEIAAAYMNRDRETRIAHLVNFQVKFETIKTLLRIAGERQWIKGKGRHAHIVELLDAIGKQSSAWKKSLIAVGKTEIKTKSPELESYD
ncbi:MAG: four helix bundle protein [Muribaculaceae bacterium]|nr:four helix bundle protein [Muribaculaceae bacterium]